MNISLNDKKVWEKLELEAYDGVIDLSPLPAAAYKYFSELTGLYRVFRFEEISREAAASAKADLLREYETNVEKLRRSRRVYAAYQDAIRRSEMLRAEINKSADPCVIAVKACEVIELLTGEDGFADRQKRKIGRSAENDCG